ncbi:hypothetical protein CHARACLAT_014687 [Characodon lateralis]|uniref:Uncharacterized protein n=1 Tax=Characodon lateralis TaxID=208331 RepID=A0ABU7EV96_9TELE|nr:hypothetical protein [Characodon lateralis]
MGFTLLHFSEKLQFSPGLLIQRNKCTLKFWGWRSKVPCLSETVKLPALILEEKRNHPCILFFPFCLSIYKLSLHFPAPSVLYCTPKFAAGELAILMKWSVVLGLIRLGVILKGFYREEGRIKRKDDERTG